MKKLLLVAAVGVAVFMSAGNAQPEKESKSKKSCEAYCDVVVATTCTATYSQRFLFDTVPTTQYIQDVATDMNIALCGEEKRIDTSVKAKDSAV